MSKPFLLFRGPVETVSGYGAHSRDLLWSFYESKLFDIKIDSCFWGSTPMNALDTDNNLFHLWIKNNIVTELQIQPDYYVQVTVANEFQPLGKYNIGVTAGVETNMIPKDWITGCNKMNLVITTSNFSKGTMLLTQYSDMLPTKIGANIEVLFEGVDTVTFKKLDYSELPNCKIKNYLDNIENDFCFLFVGHWLKGNLGQDRKDVGMLIKTFAETFSGEKNQPALILKTSAATFSVKERERISTMIKNIVSEIPNKPPVYLVFGQLSDEEMNCMYNHPKIKSLVSFTKGEGFGRPLLEFSMSGKPIIASNWSGHLDFLNSEEAVLLDGELKDVDDSAVDQFIIKGSKWFQVNYETASHKLKDMVINYEAHLIKSEKLRLKNMENFSMYKMTNKLSQIMQNCLGQQRLNESSLPKLIRAT